MQQRIAAVTIVFNDKAYGNVKRTQNHKYGGKVIASDLHNPDFVAYAESFGAQGLRATTPGALQGALRQGFDHDGPTVIEVPLGSLPGLEVVVDCDVVAIIERLIGAIADDPHAPALGVDRVVGSSPSTIVFDRMADIHPHHVPLPPHVQHELRSFARYHEVGELDRPPSGVDFRIKGAADVHGGSLDSLPMTQPGHSGSMDLAFSRT